MRKPVPKRGFSIRRRILALATALLLVAAGILIVFIHDYAQRAADRAFDRLLAASALTIAGAVQVEDDGIFVELPFAAFSMFSGRDRVFYAVEDATGRLVTGYEDLAAARPNLVGPGPEFADLDYRGELMRVTSVARLTSAANAANWVTIHVAETQGEREALSAEILSNAIVPVIALTLLAMALVWFGIGRMFAPLTELERDLSARSPDDLSPITVPVPSEVSQLVGALNGFMSRLGKSMERLSGLVAEAAHEVRTPLASLRAQAEVAMDETDPEALRRRVGKIHLGAVQAGQLVSQLLMDATVSHRLDTRQAGTTTLSIVIDDVMQRLEAEAAARLTVSIAPDAADAPLRGDRVALREMLRNVIDNALTYSEDGVEVGASMSDGHLSIAIADRGPGIPAGERDMVLERFRRGSASQGKAGSGLGLSIVRRVVEANRGTLALSDRGGGGLVVRIALPVEAAPMRNAAPVLALFALAAVLLVPLQSPLAAGTLYPAPEAESGRLTIVGTTDTPLFERFIAAYQQLNPSIAIVYAETDTLPLYRQFVDGSLTPAPDLLVSSAADLQLKLANDGYALAHDSPFLADLPDWARWRNEVFGFTFEPAVIIYNPDLVSADEVPRTHLGLAELLETQPERFTGRIATYDIATSGVGYLLAAQDQVISSNFWRLAAAFGRVRAQFSGSSPAILNGVAAGSLAIGYNVLGSYAFARQAEGARIEIVVPDDYVLVLTRAMVIPRSAAAPELARSFVDFALSPAGQAVASGPAALGSVVPGGDGPWTAEAIAARGRGVIQPIPMGPALLVALDGQRRSRFLQSWSEIVAPRSLP
jgi:two-component system sensor histidine kinase TctE